MRACFPPNVLPIPHDVLAPHPQHDPLPQQRVHLCLVSVLDHRDAPTEDRHAVALHQGSVPLAANVILRALSNQKIQSCRIEPRAPPAEANALPTAADEDVDVIRGKGLQAGLHFFRAEQSHAGRQDEALGVRELGTPSEFVLHDRAPQVHFTQYAEPVQSDLAQVV